MDVFEAIKARKSVRKYLGQPVEKKKLNKVLEAARLAPSASNRQEWRFVVVQDKDIRKKLMQASDFQVFVGQAPVVIVACAKTDGHVMKCGQACHPIDVAIALDHITLMAAALGLGTCWIGHFNANKVKEILGIPKTIEIIALMPLGYPANSSIKEKKRFSFDKIVSLENWKS